MKTVKVKDLKDQIGMIGLRPILKCFDCGSENSANKGDYFQFTDNYVFECCEKPMKQVIKHVVYKNYK